MALQNVVAGTPTNVLRTGEENRPLNQVDLARGYFKVETYPHHAIIYRPGDAAEKAFLIKRGQVRLVGAGKTSRRSVLALLRPGDVFGDVQRDPTAAMGEMAVAHGEVEVWTIDGRDLQALCQARPALAMEVIGGLTGRLRLLRKRAQALAFKEVPARLAEQLLVLSESHGERCPHGGEVDLRQITQQDLADLVGAGRSFVSTLINEMKRQGILGSVGRTLCIRDPKALAKLAEPVRR